MPVPLASEAYVVARVGVPALVLVSLGWVWYARRRERRREHERLLSESRRLADDEDR